MRVFAALEDSPKVAGGWAIVGGRLPNRGRLSFRSVGGGVLSRGELDRDLRFLRLLRVCSSFPSSSILAFSKAFHALISSCDSGCGEIGSGFRRIVAVFRKRVAAPCRAATLNRERHS